MKSRLVMALPAAFFSITPPFWIKKEIDSFAWIIRDILDGHG
jgi:hypothetical protein